MKTLGLLLLIVPAILAQTSPCDVNHDGSINVVDVQLVINQALGFAACSADLNSDGVCNIVDVQRVISAALGGACLASGSNTNPNGITVQTPDLSKVQSGTMTVQLTLSANLPQNPASQFAYYVIDGREPQIDGSAPTAVSPNACHLFQSPSAARFLGLNVLNDTYGIDTTLLPNGPHTLVIGAETILPSTYTPIYGPVTFTTNNGHLPWQLRTNYHVLWMTPGQSIQLTPKLVYTDKVISPLSSSSTTFSTNNSTVATVDSAGNVTAGQVGDAMITVGLNSSSIYTVTTVHVNTANVTPHFGKDGSLLTAYDPTKSLFVRSMFFLGTNDVADPQTLADVQAAKINTLEAGLYATPGQFGSDINSWMSFQDWEDQGVANALATSGMSVLFNADGMARGDDLLYNSTRGPGATWVPSPIVYAFNWAKSLGRAIGVEMVDEVSFIYNTYPNPQGQLGLPNGPQQIACTNNQCWVTWPQREFSACNRFLITGATSVPALNRDITNPYTFYPPYVDGGFSFTATNVGTYTFTPATDPNLTLQVYACYPQGTNGLDYTHNDAIQVLMSTIHSVSGHTPITWPVAGDMITANTYWQGDPNVSDYATFYMSNGVSSYPWGSTLQDMQITFDRNFNLKYPEIQRNRPILWEAGGEALPFSIPGTPVPVSSFVNQTVTFSQPHNITDLVNAAPRFSLSGNSNTSLNGDYYVYEIVDVNTVKVYQANPPPNMTVNGYNSTPGGTVTFADGVSFPMMGMVVPDPNNENFSFGPGQCPAGEPAGQIATVSNDSFGPYNGPWYLKKLTVNPDTSCMYGIESLPSGTGTGGTALIIYNNNPPPTGDGGQLPITNATDVMWAAANGLAGVRVYSYIPNWNAAVQQNALFPESFANGFQLQPGANPRYDGPDSAARWNALSNAFNLINDIEPYLLQPKLNSPDYGAYMVTAARTSSYGKMLMMINFLEGPATETVDLSEYNPAGGPGTMYRMTPASLTTQPVSGTSQQITFAAGETIVWTF